MNLKLLGTTLAFLVVVVLARPEDELIAGTRTLAANFYKALKTTKQNENLIFSPLSVQTIMGLLVSATRDDNKEIVKQIISGMSLPRTEHDRQIAFKKVLGTLKADNDFKAFDVTKMYFKYGYSVQDWYRRTVQDVYSVEIENVDFGNLWSTTQSINEWVSRNTDNGMRNFINPSDISSNRRNLLINTLYLRGNWLQPFQQNNIPKAFYSPRGVKQVTMMIARHSYNYYEDNNAQYLKLELLRDGGGAEMIFVLPKQRLGLITLENNVQELLRHVPFTSEAVQLILPKFSFNHEIELKSVLENMGVRNLFNWGAELEGLSPRHPFMKITDVFQKAGVYIDEWGISPGVVRYGGMDDCCYDYAKNFTADHPFFFYITLDDAVLYAGRVMEV